MNKSVWEMSMQNPSDCRRTLFKINLNVAKSMTAYWSKGFFNHFSARA